MVGSGAVTEIPREKERRSSGRSKALLLVVNIIIKWNGRTSRGGSSFLVDRWQWWWCALTFEITQVESSLWTRSVVDAGVDEVR